MMLWEKQTARRTRRPPIGLILLAGLIVVPLAELAVLIEIGGWLGLGPTLALIILTAAGGVWVLRRRSGVTGVGPERGGSRPPEA